MLTQRQREAMLFIEAEIERTGGVSPTIREIAEHLQYRSAQYAHRLVEGLEERGFIRRLPHRARAIEIARPVSRFAVYRFNPETKGVEVMTRNELSPED